jgi:hypothetical protein
LIEMPAICEMIPTVSRRPAPLARQSAPTVIGPIDASAFLPVSEVAQD